MSELPAYCTPNDWIRRHMADFRCTDFPRGARVIDVGCGWGLDLQELAARGCEARGFDIDVAGIERCRAMGFEADVASAEALPVPDECADGVALNSVLVFTDEARVMHELRRVLRPGGVVRLCTQGAGYAMYLLESGPGWKRRLFALRMMLNGLLRNFLGLRLPGWLGDVSWHSPRVLAARLARLGFVVDELALSPAHRGLPTFIYMAARKA